MRYLLALAAAFVLTFGLTEAAVNAVMPPINTYNHGAVVATIHQQPGRP